MYMYVILIILLSSLSPCPSGRPDERADAAVHRASADAAHEQLDGALDGAAAAVLARVREEEDRRQGPAASILVQCDDMHS